MNEVVCRIWVVNGNDGAPVERVAGMKASDQRLSQPIQVAIQTCILFEKNYRPMFQHTKI